MFVGCSCVLSLLQARVLQELHEKRATNGRSCWWVTTAHLRQWREEERKLWFPRKLAVEDRWSRPPVPRCAEISPFLALPVLPEDESNLDPVLTHRSRSRSEARVHDVQPGVCVVTLLSSLCREEANLSPQSHPMSTILWNPRWPWNAVSITIIHVICSRALPPRVA